MTNKKIEAVKEIAKVLKKDKRRTKKSIERICLELLSFPDIPDFNLSPPQDKEKTVND